jgi:hypothetical protein
MSSEIDLDVMSDSNETEVTGIIYSVNKYVLKYILMCFWN